MLARALAAALLVGARAQQPGTLGEESHIASKFEECTANGGCQSQSASFVLDMNWRWLHSAGGYKNCRDDAAGGWDAKFCPDAETCARNCETEGLSVDDYSQTYGVDTVEGGVKLSYVSPKGNVASRLYMLQDDENYQMFKLKNREFSLTVDVSSLGCGLNGAMYFVEMPQNGGKDGDLNNAGAKYGTGYCDAQCPRDMKFVKGLAATELTEVGNVGEYGACCAEMDIFEANNKASSYTAHPCSFEGTFRCKGDEECGNRQKGYLSTCDKNGCGMNSYQQGNRNFYGEGKTVDSSKPFTLVTQFITSDGTDDGDLVEIRRFYVQDGQKIEHAKAQNVAGLPDSIKDGMCEVMAHTYGEDPEFNFKNMGGLKSMGDALDRGMVATFSIWDDAGSRMLWLDAEKTAIDQNTSSPGVSRGPCPFESGDAQELRKTKKDSFVIFKDVKVGEIGSTMGSVRSTGSPLEKARRTVEKIRESLPVPAVPSIPVPAAPAQGQARCCWGASCGSTNSCAPAAGWCSQSPMNCEKSCGGIWCAASVSLASVGSSQSVKRHRRLRAQPKVDNILLQKFRSHIKRSASADIEIRDQSSNDEL